MVRGNLLGMRRPVALVLVLALSACQGDIYDPSHPINPGSSPDDVGNPGGLVEPSEGPTPVAPTSYRFDGPYAVKSHLDLAASGVFGDRVSDALMALSEMHDNPAGAILEVLSWFNIPVYSEVWAALPDFLKDMIDGWLNDALFFPLLDGVPAIDQAFQVGQDIFHLSRDLQLHTELSLKPPHADGTMHSTHVITGIGFELWDIDAVLPIPPELGALTEAEPHAHLELVSSPNPAMPQGLLTVDRHTFSIPYGAMILEAAKYYIFEPAGADSLGGYLVNVIDCDAVATNFVDNCATDWLGSWTCLSSYISHDDAEAWCVDGLYGVAGVVEDALNSLTFDMFALEQGRAKMFDRGADDAYGDGIISELRDGMWKARISMGLEERVIPATFEGVRIGD